MKLAQGLGLAGTVSIFAMGLWLGCNSSTTITGDDGGTPLPGTDSGSGSGGTDSGSGSGGIDSGSGGTEGGTALSCDGYCTTVMNNCQGDNAQYGTKADCMNACQFFPVGTAADTSGDTLGCHTYHAGAAGTAPNPHCWHAGAYGYGVCGGTCDDFCALALGWCSADAGFAGSPPYASLADCKASCNLYAIADAGSGADGGAPPPGAFNATGPAGGDTLDCRQYHLGASLAGGATQALHCQHPGADSGPCQ